MRGADLRGADLENSDLSSADLEGADLGHVLIMGCPEWKTNLRGAALFSTNLKGVKNLTVDQLEEVESLCDTFLDDELLNEVQDRFPHLLEYND